MLEARMRTFDEVGRTPVLLSMLILVLGERRRWFRDRVRP